MFGAYYAKITYFICNIVSRRTVGGKRLRRRLFQLFLEMLLHGVTTDPSRAFRCPVTSRVSSAPLGLVSSLSFNRGRKEQNKLFINVDRCGI
jgi:hypothetical protein